MSDLSQLLQKRYMEEGGLEDRPKSDPRTRSCDLSQQEPTSDLSQLL